MKGLQSDRIYWKMYLHSAWGEDVTREELIDILNDAAKPPVIIETKPKGMEKIINKLEHL